MKKLPPRDDTRCAPQEEVDERMRRCRGEYTFLFADARQEDADIDTGALVCKIINLRVPEEEAQYFKVRDDALLLMTENPYPDDVLQIIEWHAKDVAAGISVLQRQGIYDRPSPIH
jgi:hypothetical protein